MTLRAKPILDEIADRIVLLRAEVARTAHNPPTEEEQAFARHLIIAGKAVTEMLKMMPVVEESK